jgi:hypothetical protein
VPLEELSNSLLGGQGPGLTFVVYGAIIVIIARFLPSGLLSLLDRRKVTVLIDAKNVVKAFGAFKAVDDASVSVEEGDILGLIGPNGRASRPSSTA